MSGIPRMVHTQGGSMKHERRKIVALPGPPAPAPSTEPPPTVETAEAAASAEILLRALPTALILLDPDFRIRTVNQSALRLLGYREDELVGKPMASVMGSPRQAVAGLTTMADLLFEDTGRTVELTYYTRDGRAIPVTFSSSLLRDVNGTGAILCAAQPVPDRETGSGANRAAVAEVRSRILANVSHEVRTPLHAVLGMAELLLGTELTLDQREFVESILQSGRTMAATLRDLIDFGQGDPRAAALKPCDFDLEGTVHEAVQHVAAAARDKGLTLSARIDADVPRELHGDAIKLRQVLTHLLANAVRFTRNGGVEVRVELDYDVVPVPGPPHGTRLRFRVKDTGVGIAPEKARVIFEPFHRGDADGDESLGLGLAIVRRLVDLLGGRAWLTSKPGEGSTFFFTVRFDAPRSRTNDISLIRGLTDADPGFAPGPAKALRRLHVLVAEDNPTQQRVVCRYLERWGHRVRATVNGIGAVEAWESGEFDLLLLDSDMPGIDGVTAAATIRRGERETARHIPIIAFTSGDDADERARCLSAGVDITIAKPVEAGTLRRAIDTLLGTA